jgi:hypothetical protein
LNWLDPQPAADDEFVASVEEAARLLGMEIPSRWTDVDGIRGPGRPVPSTGDDRGSTMDASVRRHPDPADSEHQAEPDATQPATARPGATDRSDEYDAVPQDTTGSGDHHASPVDGSDARPEPIPRDKPSLLAAALALSQRGPDELASFTFLKQELAAFARLHPEDVDRLNTRKWDELDDDVKTTAIAIWKKAAEVVARAATELNQRREFSAALATWHNDPTRKVSSEAEVRRVNPLVAQVWDAMKELAKDVLGDAMIEIAQAMLIEMLLPGAHLITPPDGLLAAIFTAGAFGELANGAA